MTDAERIAEIKARLQKGYYWTHDAVEGDVQDDMAWLFEQVEILQKRLLNCNQTVERQQQAAVRRYRDDYDHLDYEDDDRR